MTDSTRQQGPQESPAHPQPPSSHQAPEPHQAEATTTTPVPPTSVPDPRKAFRSDYSTVTAPTLQRLGSSKRRPASSTSNRLPKRDFIYRPHAYAVDPLPPAEMEAQQKALARIQIATPLSVLVALASLVITSILVKPGLDGVSQRHPNYFTPASSFLLTFWAIIFLLQVGYCILITVSRKQETKKLIINGVGLRLAIANFGLALWAIFWVIDQHWGFVVGEVILAINAVLLLLTMALLSFKYHPDYKHPLDWIFVHVPVKLFLVVLLQIDLWQQLSIIVGWDLRSNKTDSAGPGLWPSFGLITGVGGLLPALWIFATADFTWAVAGIFLHLSILFRGGNGHPNLSHRRPEIVAAVVLAIAMQGVALFSGIAWTRLQKRQEGQIALPITEEERRQHDRQQQRRQGDLALGAADHGASSSANHNRTAIQAGSSTRGTVGVGVTDLESGTPGVEEQQDEPYRDEPRVTRTLGQTSG
ncbi:hypothetical protein OC846_002085 [Tilletia horrida]|uniref:Uncharacterized protein n=1 Tax=Tilletia horrida TaxID=155126 RepID=A0AAN6GSZ0_9BASI|nr:hypothetical protein OC846_002085 [Tilletia horrida]KAK0568107.1 hypothetical protein OC861_002272 [Tilletia horrida]